MSTMAHHNFIADLDGDTYKQLQELRFLDQYPWGTIDNMSVALDGAVIAWEGLRPIFEAGRLTVCEFGTDEMQPPTLPIPTEYLRQATYRRVSVSVSEAALGFIKQQPDRIAPALNWRMRRELTPETAVRGIIRAWRCLQPYNVCGRLALCTGQFTYSPIVLKYEDRPDELG